MSREFVVRSAAQIAEEDPVPASITEESIHRLVHGFYAAVRDDDVIGPIFGREIADDRWPVHLDKMCAFWSSVLLKTTRYGGRPLPPHLRLAELSDAHFSRWLGLFRATARAVFDADGAALVIMRAERIAHSFRLALAYHRGEDSTLVRPLPGN